MNNIVMEMMLVVGLIPVIVIFIALTTVLVFGLILSLMIKRQRKAAGKSKPKPLTGKPINLMTVAAFLISASIIAVTFQLYSPNALTVQDNTPIESGASEITAVIESSSESWRGMGSSVGRKRPHDTAIVFVDLNSDKTLTLTNPKAADIDTGDTINYTIYQMHDIQMFGVAHAYHRVDYTIN